MNQTQRTLLSQKKVWRSSCSVMLCSLICFLLLFSASVSVSAKTVSLLSTVSEATSALRTAMKHRETRVTLTMPYVTYQEGMGRTLYENAIAHTGKGDEGDFLKWQCAGWSCDITKTGDAVSYDYTLRYLDTAEQAAALDALLPQAEAKLNIASNASDKTIFLAIYDYICKNVAYAKQETESARTAYHALTEHEAVCQGYSTLLYRMLLDYGIDNRIVVSTTHAWNLVKLDGLYYEADSTWDAAYTQQNQPYRYMLLANLHESIPNDTEHVWSTEELDATMETYPRATKDYNITTEEDVEDDDSSARYVLSDVATFILTAPTLYGEYDDGSTIKKGYYAGTEPVVMAVNWMTLQPMKQGKDYKVSIQKAKTKTTILLTGFGLYKGKVSFAFPTKLLPSTITKVSKVSNNRIKLNWSKVTNATGYLIYRQTNNGKWVKIAKISSSNTTTYTDTNCIKGNTYRYRMKTFYDAYTSGYSKIKSVTFK